MIQRKKVVFNWSGGKDSALALHKIIQNKEYEIISLLTTINQNNNKSSVHGIPLKILEKQAFSLGIPLYTVVLSEDLHDYDQKILSAIKYFKKQGVTHFAFGDIHLTDVKSYRQQKLQPLGIEVLEPLWDKTSEEIIAEFLRSGLKTKIIVTQADKLSKEFIGKDLTEELIRTFPKDADVCGENGEYHTLVYDGAIFRFPVDFTVENVVKTSYDITLDTLEIKTFEYWQAVFAD